MRVGKLDALDPLVFDPHERTAAAGAATRLAGPAVARCRGEADPVCTSAVEPSLTGKVA